MCFLICLLSTYFSIESTWPDLFLDVLSPLCTIHPKATTIEIVTFSVMIKYIVGAMQNAKGSFCLSVN